MKKLFVLTLSLITLSFPAFAAGQVVKVSVNGLVCDFCARALEKTFGKQEAVEDIGVDLDTKIVTVNLKEGQDMDDERIKELITDSGYNVEGITRE
ncbi:MAG: cation transporter [Micavibrio sp.]|nr:cation transporter [Micavibrio sp.]